MAIFPSSAIPSAAGDFTIDQSLRFDDGSSTYLNRTPSSAGNRRTWTFSTWMKMGTLVGSGSTSMFTAYWGNNDNGYLQFGFDSSDRLGVWGYDTTWRVSTQVFRDTSAWYHIVLAVDTTNGTAQNRIRVYINGSEITVWTTNNTVTEDLDTAVNYNGAHYLGSLSTTQAFHDGYLSEVHLIDGTQLTPSSFGETGDYGEWKPKKVSGLTYGTNGFYLSFAGGGIMSATGGTITTDGDYKVNSFTADGTFTPSADGYVEYLVVGGGGNGAGFGASSVSGGGGGAGGYRTGYLAVTGGTGYSITVGAATEDSVFSSITSAGGGNGGQPTPTSGGSGGGSGAASPSGAAGTSGQGNAGGTGTGTWGVTTTRSGGGGGSGGVGGNSDGTNGGAAGAGTASSITGSSVTYAAGGEGVAHTRNTAGTPGAANTGNGGGGTGGSGGNSGGAGGSGIVIIRYKFQ